MSPCFLFSIEIRHGLIDSALCQNPVTRSSPARRVGIFDLSIHLKTMLRGNKSVDPPPPQESNTLLS